ncbi:ribosome maturation factor RimM [Anoxynatronum buryatiense]|uniref:Ribosome maturation factor RimM n=1 Tax=Anoxynatronum buryatiense TaxID=489973 RepID=A0AA46AI72_9CLOT|nr:ribosome maturation factor RimM [Anoxynatronum buryatiense]SMP47101.1 16S rRNA processing protein RimM [Anoxynatronum buryatiense]
MKYLKVGFIATTHGIKGGLRVRPMTDDAARFLELEWLYIEGSDQKWVISEVKIRPKDVILYFKGLNHIDQAELLRGKHLYTDETQRPALEADRHYVSDLVGLQAVYPDGREMGTLTQVISTAAHDVYVITSPDGKDEWMVPAVKVFVLEILPEDGKIVIDPIEGMLS